MDVCNNSAAGGLQDAVGDCFSCPICHEILNLACETSCGHSFCEYCINKWLETKQTCPVCNRNPLPVHPSFLTRTVIAKFLRGKENGSPDAINFEEEAAKGSESFRNSKFAEAIQHYSNCLATNKYLDIIYCNRAAAYMKLHQYQRALEDLENSLKIDPNSIKAIIRKARCHMHLKDYKAASEAYNTARALDSNYEWRQEIAEGQLCVQRVWSEHSPSPRSSSPFAHRPHLVHSSLSRGSSPSRPSSPSSAGHTPVGVPRSQTFHDYTCSMPLREAASAPGDKRAHTPYNSRSRLRRITVHAASNPYLPMQAEARAASPLSTLGQRFTDMRTSSPAPATPTAPAVSSLPLTPPPVAAPPPASAGVSPIGQRAVSCPRHSVELVRSSSAGAQWAAPPPSCPGRTDPFHQWMSRSLQRGHT